MNAIGIITIIFAILICIGVVTCLLLNFKIKKLEMYWVISLIGAVLLVLINIKDFKQITGALIQNSSINPLKILVFFISMTILSITLDNLNFFNFIANKCVKFAKNSQFKLFIIFYLLVSILTIFTSNDIVILAFVPFICYFCKSSNINPAPYVFATFVSANTWSMMLIIGNPTNVYISTFAGINFTQYFLKMAFPTLISGIVSLLLLILLFRKQLQEKIQPTEQKEISINKPLVILNVCILACCTILLAISSYIGIEMWIVALCFAVAELLINLIICIFKKEDKTYIINSLKRAPWTFVPFLISMFLIVMCLDANGITKIMSDFHAKSNSIFVYGIFSFLFANVMNNIPMTALFSCILGSGTFSLNSAFAVIIGSNLGALLSPIGALAGIMFLNILKEKNVKFSILDFIKYGAIISIISLFATLGMLYLV